MTRHPHPTRRRFLVRAGAATLAGALPAARAQDPITLRLHHLLPPGAPVSQRFLEPWAQKVAKDSGGRLRVQLYPSMQLGGNPAQLFDQARDGVVDIVWTLPGYSAGRFPAIEAFELPFVTRTAEGSSRALWEYHLANGLDRSELREVKVLALHTSGAGHLHLVRKPVEKLADFRGLRLRAPSRQTTRLLSALGATPVGIPVTQMGEALSKSLIDGVLFQWETVPSFKVAELVKFHSETQPRAPALYNLTYLLAMNQARYQGLPAELRRVIDEASGAAASVQGGAAQASFIGEGRKAARDAGNRINVIPAQELATWEKAAEPVFAAWSQEVAAKGFDPAALLRSARALEQRWDAA